MTDHVYEITITAKNAQDETSVVHAEYMTATGDPHTAAREMVDSAVKQKGNSRVREIDPSR